MLRAAVKSDIPSLFRVRTSVTQNHLNIKELADRGVTEQSVSEMLEGDYSRTWVIEDAGTVRGFSMADDRDGSVFALFIEPGFERRGYGRTLLSTAEEWLFSRGWKTIWLNTGRDPSNRSHSVYRAAGWRLVGDADHEDVRYEKTRPA